MGYVTLGARPAFATLDTTGQNTGNYTATFDKTVINSSVPYFECYHVYLKAPLLTNQATTCNVMINGYFWDATLVGNLNSWDPSQPMILRPEDTLFFLFNIPVPQNTVPLVTCWFRYSTS